MPDNTMQKWAEVLTTYSVSVKPGNTVAIRGDIAGESLLRAIYRQVVDLGAHPVLYLSLPGVNEYLLANGSDDQLTWIDPLERFYRVEADVSIYVIAETNTRSMTGVDPKRSSLRQKARTELMTTSMQRFSDGELDWTLTLFPTDAHAQDAEMSTAEYAAFVEAACKLDQADPVAAWENQSAEQERIIEWLQPRSEIRVEGPGTDFTVGVEGRKWINANGKQNFPDGEVFTGPVESSANGHIRFSFPAIVSGREVENIELRFVDGRVVDASASRGEDLLLSQLDTDEGARHLGEFAIGTNFGIDRFTKQILFDEKIGGTVHMAVGSGYPETGSTNQSAIHWDMICDLREDGIVSADGEPLLVNGRIVI